MKTSRLFVPSFPACCLYILFASLIFSHQIHAQFVQSTSTSLPGVFAASVAWGDYDGDGKLDIVLSGTDTTATAITKIYHNNGNGVFTTVASLTGVANGSLAWGDYDNDGDLDILLTGLDNTATALSKVYRNNGNGTFSTIATLTGVYNSAVAWGDYDNDGDLDILLTGQIATLTGISRIYRNNGDNTFTNIFSLAGVYNSAVAWGDYDNDGRLDILLSGQTGLITSTARVYHNDGNGTFTSIASLTGVSKGSLAWGDYDNDGDLDILLTGTVDGLGAVSLSTVYRNNSNGTFTQTVTLLGLLSGSAVWGDYDNDGDLDIVQTGVSLGLSSSIVYRNDGDDNFTLATTLTGLLMSSVAWGDYDNDNDLDILVSGDTGANPLTLLYTNVVTAANTAPVLPTGLQVTYTSTTSAIVRWNKATDAQTPQNGISYAVSIGTTSGGVQIKSPMAQAQTGRRMLPALGNVYETTATFITGLTPGATYYWGVQAVDGGLVGSTFATGSLTMPLPITTVGFSPAPNALATLANTNIGITFNTAVDASSVTGANIRVQGSFTGSRSGDGAFSVPTITTASFDPAQNFKPGELVTVTVTAARNILGVQSTKATVYSFTIAAQGGFGNFVEYTRASIGADIQGVAIADVDGDSDLDLAVIGSTGTLSILLNNGNATYTVGAQYVINTPLSVASCDFNRDGSMDLAVFQNGNFTILLNNGNGIFSPSGMYATGTLITNATTGDMDGDGDIDLVVAASTGTCSVYFNNGSALFSTGATYSSLAASVVVGDFDGDRDMDIAAAHTAGSGTITVHLNNGNGVFSTSGTYGAGIFVHAISVGDMDSDGNLDLLSANDNGSVSLLRNNGNGVFSVSTSSSLGTQPRAIAAGDVDGNGSLDILTMNAGSQHISILLNAGNGTFSTANPGSLGISPRSFALADVDGNGSLDIVVGGSGASQMAILLNQAPVARLAFSTTHSSGTDGFNSGVTTATMNASNQATVLVTTGTFSAVGIPTATGANFTVNFSFNAGGPSIINSTTQSYNEGISTTSSNLTFQWNSIGTTIATLTASVSDSVIPSTSLTLVIQPYIPPASQLVVTGITPANPNSGQDFTITVEARNSFGQAVAVTQATILAMIFTNPYLSLASGSTQTTVVAGQSSTTLTLALNSTSSATVSSLLNIVATGGLLFTTSQSITINPAAAYIASRLAVAGITPTNPNTGQNFTLSIEAHNSLGQTVPVTQATILALSFNNPYLSLASGSTSAMLSTGQSSTALTIVLNSTSTASVSTVLNVAVIGGALSATTQSITISPLLSSIASRLEVTGITPANPNSGQSFTVSIESRNSFGQAVAVTQATTLALSFSSPYLLLASGSTLATLFAGQNNTMLVIALNNASSASVSATLAIETMGGGGIASTSQSILINKNRRPFISTLSDVSINEDSFAVRTFTIGDTQTPVTGLTVTATSSNQSLLPNNNIILSSISSSMTSVLLPAVNQYGEGIVTITVSDGITSSTGTFTMTVAPVNDAPIALPDYDSVCGNGNKIILPLANDVDLESGPLFINALIPGAHGMAQMLDSVSFLYAPDPGYSGVDSLTYTIGDTEGGFSTATIMITIHPPVIANAGEDIHLCTTGSVQLQAMGGVSYSWSPATGLNNPDIANPIAMVAQTTSYVVTVTDIHGCQAKDTVMIFVQPKKIILSAMLEGPYTGIESTMSTLLQEQGLLPSSPPYSESPFNYNGGESMQSLPANVVDWVLLELRSTPDPSSLVYRKAGLLRSNGEIVDISGAPISMDSSVPLGNYYIVLYHRNHLAIMSATAVELTQCSLEYSFAGSNSQGYSEIMDAMQELDTDVYGMFAADASQDGIDNATDRVLVRMDTGHTGYLLTDLNLDGIVNAVDRVLVSNNTFIVTQVP